MSSNQTRAMEYSSDLNPRLQTEANSRVLRDKIKQRLACTSPTYALGIRSTRLPTRLKFLRAVKLPIIPWIISTSLFLPPSDLRSPSNLSVSWRIPVPGRMLLMGSVVWCIALLVSCLPTRILATPFNITVDDTNGDPLTLTNVSYTPPASWYTNQDCASGDPGAPGECPPGLQANQAYDLTYHGSAFFAGRSTGLNATFTFQGTAVYVYCILNAGVFTSNMTFHLDGQQVGAYTYNSVVTDDTGIPPYQYSVPVFQFGSLSNDNHTFTLTNGDVTTEPGPYSIVLLDYFQYTTELTEEQTHSSPNPTPTNTPSLVTHGITRKSRDVIIAVAVVAAILLITMFILVFSFMRRLHADGGEVPAKNFDSSSFGENRLMSEGVASNVSGEGFVHPFISPSRQMFSPEHATSVDGALQTSTNLDSQPISESSQFVDRRVMSDAHWTPAFPSSLPSSDKRAGTVPVPPPGVPVLDSPPPTPSNLCLVKTTLAGEGWSSHYDGSALGMSEGRQTTTEMSGPYNTSVHAESMKSPPPKYWSRAGSFFTR